MEYQDVNGTASIEFNLCEKTARQCSDEMNDYANVINLHGDDHDIFVYRAGVRGPSSCSDPRDTCTCPGG